MASAAARPQNQRKTPCKICADQPEDLVEDILDHVKQLLETGFLLLFLHALQGRGRKRRPILALSWLLFLGFGEHRLCRFGHLGALMCIQRARLLCGKRRAAGGADQRMQRLIRDKGALDAAIATGDELTARYAVMCDGDAPF